MLKMKKNIKLVLTAVVMMFVVSGCENQIPEMTEEENALITEYAAGLLLNYHADYNGRLVDTSVPTEETLPVVPEQTVPETLPEETTEDVSSEEASVSSNSTEEVKKPTMSIAQMIGIDGFDIQYRTFEVCDNYPGTENSPEELFFSMKAGQGNKLLVMKIDITNTTSQEKMFDTLSMTELGCKMLIDGTKTQRAYVSMLENDFMAINRNFVPGESYEAVVVTEMPEEEAQGVTSVELQLKNAGQEISVKASE